MKECMYQCLSVSQSAMHYNIANFVVTKMWMDFRSVCFFLFYLFFDNKEKPWKHLTVALLYFTAIDKKKCVALCMALIMHLQVVQPHISVPPEGNIEDASSLDAWLCYKYISTEDTILCACVHLASLNSTVALLTRGGIAARNNFTSLYELIKYGAFLKSSIHAKNKTSSEICFSNK